ncbi:hypothetical protein DUI87_23828 [Hirundo rustica rustica]|uniref:Uncharacterized protein n=1 Tax=Hirundo rustica rustica TaxID=333673 RepID=A0A3M0JEX0_HIRRU|nr:hypothetical protein DUI87_23828 [Hirundo rustica rustica]
MEEKLSVSQQSVQPAQKASCVLGCMERREGQQVKGGDCGPLVHFFRAHLHYYICVLGLQQKEDMDLLESVQRRVREMLGGLEHLCYEDGLGRECVSVGFGRDACAQIEAQVRPYDDNIQILFNAVVCS